MCGRIPTERTSRVADCTTNPRRWLSPARRTPACDRAVALALPSAPAYRPTRPESARQLPALSLGRLRRVCDKTRRVPFLSSTSSQTLTRSSRARAPVDPMQLPPSGCSRRASQREHSAPDRACRTITRPSAATRQASLRSASCASDYGEVARRARQLRCRSASVESCALDD